MIFYDVNGNMVKRPQQRDHLVELPILLRSSPLTFVFRFYDRGASAYGWISAPAIWAGQAPESSRPARGGSALAEKKNYGRLKNS